MEDFFHHRTACCVEREKLRAVQIDAGPCCQHSPSGEKSRIAGNDDSFDAEFTAERGRVQRAAAAAHHHRQIAWIMPALNSDELERVDHVGFGETDHGPCRGGD